MILAGVNGKSNKSFSKIAGFAIGLYLQNRLNRQTLQDSASRNLVTDAQWVLVLGLCTKARGRGDVHKLSVSAFAKTDAFRRLNFRCRLCYCEKKIASLCSQ